VSLARLGTDHLDLYLLHWPSRDTELSRIVAAFKTLRAARKTRAWGVSNFKVSDIGRPLSCFTRSLRDQSGPLISYLVQKPESADSGRPERPASCSPEAL